MNQESVKVTLEDYLEAQESYMGWCTVCQEFTRECCEPDAREYDCPECEQDTCFGAEQAVLEGLIEVDDSEELESGNSE